MGTVKLKSVTIKGYRSCADTHMEVNDDLTVLIGKNGSGKTNIMKALMLLQKLAAGEYKVVNGNKPGHAPRLDVLLIIDNKEWSVNFCLYLAGKEEELYISAEPILATDLASGRSVEINVQDLVRRYYFTGDELVLEDVPEQHRMGVLILNFFKSFLYYPAAHFLDPAQCSRSLEIDGKEMTPLNTLNAHDQFMADLYWLYKTDPEAFQTFEGRVGLESMGLVEAITFDEFVPGNGKAASTAHPDGFRTEIYPLFTFEGKLLGPHQLSEGTFKAMALLFYLYRQGSGLLLIDEPETGLYHEVIDSIAETLKTRARHAQIIISTHSSLLVDKLLPSNLVIVSNEAGGTTAVTLTKALSANEQRALDYYLEEKGNLGDYWKGFGF